MKGFFNWIIVISMIVSFSSCEDNNVDNGGIPSNNVTATREPGSDTYTLKFYKKGDKTVYQGTDPESISMNNAVVETKEDSVVISGLDPKQRYYFAVVFNSDHTDVSIVSETDIAVKGQPNFADLGGITTADGRSVKWGKIYRSGELSKLTDDDVAYVASLKLNAIIDFRFLEEKEKAPDNFPADVDTIPIPVVDGAYDEGTIVKWLLTGNTEAFDTMLIHVNKVLVTREQESFKEFFNHLENGGSFLYHCTKGKDRAGFATALFLSALGVDRETVMDNYLKSNEYLFNATEQTIQFVISKGLDGELLRPILEVRPEYIQIAFDIIDNEYGGIDNYLRNNLSLS